MTRKNRKIRLSPSPRKRVRKEALQYRSGAIAAYDHAADLLSDIRTLARLLESAGVRRDAEPLEATLVANAGSLIIRQTDQLHAALKANLQKALSRRGQNLR